MKVFEEALIALRDRLTREMKDIIKGAEMGTDAGDEEQSADEDEERGMAYAGQIALKERLDSVLDALAKIKAVTYGICESCHKPIGADVLRAAPESRKCAACKAK